VDTTPAGLTGGLADLRTDLDDRARRPARSLRRAGTRRRYAVNAVVAAGVAAALGIGVGVGVSDPFGGHGAVRHPGIAPRSTPPTSSPVATIGARDLVGASVLISLHPGSGWYELPQPTRPQIASNLSIFGACVMAADDPPPGTSWIGDFALRGRTVMPADRPLRQVLMQAPSAVEAKRTFHRLVVSLTSCTGHQLARFQVVRGVGERGRLIGLRYAMPGGVVHESVLLVRSGPAVTVLVAKSAPGTPPELTPTDLMSIGGSAVDNVCSTLSSPCALAPYRTHGLRPPSGRTRGGLLSAVDLPPVPGVVAAWEATTPSATATDPTITRCDRTSFAGSGAVSMRGQGYTMPGAIRPPAGFGGSEIVARFGDASAARAFASRLAADLRGCPGRVQGISELGATRVRSHAASAQTWHLLHPARDGRASVVRTAVVRRGVTVARITFRGSARFEIGHAAWGALVRRAAVRLTP
jgi:hypothetical protein